jgi:hypothetical protein
MITLADARSPARKATDASVACPCCLLEVY